MWQLDPDSMRWTQIHPRGKGPEPRRRQALCQVVRLRLESLLKACINKSHFPSRNKNDHIFLIFRETNYSYLEVQALTLDHQYFLPNSN